MSDGLINLNHPEHVTVPVLADGSALRYAFLEGMPVVTARDTEAAKDRFAIIAAFDPKGVAACAQMSPEEARTAFEEIEKRMNTR